MTLDVNLNWDAVDEPNNEYHIYRSTSSPVSISDTNEVGVVQDGTTTFTDQVPEEEGTYYYIVTAVRIEDGTEYESTASKEITVEIPVQAVGNYLDNGTLSELSANKVRINGSVVKIESVKTRQNGSIVEIQ